MSETWRHKPAARDGFIAAAPLPEELDRALDAHRETYLGPAPTVLHEIVSDTVHLDLWPHGPRDDKGLTLVTQGNSALAMPVPEGVVARCELLTYVSPDFVTEDYHVPDDRTWWPGRMLKDVARFPHSYNTWIGLGHTVSFSDPPAPLVEGSLLTAIVLLPPPEVEGFELLDVAGTKVRYLWVLPITTAELQLKQDRGPDALLDALDAAHVPFICDPSRPSAV